MGRVFIGYAVVLASSLLFGWAGGAKAEGLRTSMPGCPAVSTPSARYCGDVEKVALLGGPTVVADRTGRQEIVDGDGVIAVLGQGGPIVMRAPGAAIVAGGGSDPVTTGSITPK